jgi:hypothetical protein
MARPTAKRSGPTLAHSGLRLAGFALALAFLLAQVASRVHRAEVAHRLCAEHGALEHGPAGHAPHAQDAHGHDHVPQRVAPQSAPAPDPGSHDACELAELLNAGPAAPIAVALAQSVVPPVAAPVAARAEVRPREVRGRRESARGPPRAA